MQASVDSLLEAMRLVGVRQQLRRLQELVDECDSDGDDQAAHGRRRERNSRRTPEGRSNVVGNSHCNATSNLTDENTAAADNKHYSRVSQQGATTSGRVDAHIAGAAGAVRGLVPSTSAGAARRVLQPHHHGRMSDIVEAVTGVNGGYSSGVALAMPNVSMAAGAAAAVASPRRARQRADQQGNALQGRAALQSQLLHGLQQQLQLQRPRQGDYHQGLRTRHTIITSITRDTLLALTGNADDARQLAGGSRGACWSIDRHYSTAASVNPALIIPLRLHRVCRHAPRRWCAWTTDQRSAVGTMGGHRR